jgi:membrane protein insertase Oxa1/YidC/SpoIIIJ
MSKSSLTRRNMYYKYNKMKKEKAKEREIQEYLKEERDKKIWDSLTPQQQRMSLENKKAENENNLIWGLLIVAVVFFLMIITNG